MSNPTIDLHLTLRAADFAGLEHAHCLKGLLRPFKDKGELIDWASRCEALRDQLIGLSARLLDRSRTFPIALLPAALTTQRTGAGTTYLRWRTHDRKEAGRKLLARLMAADTTPAFLLTELAQLESQRVILNMQIGLVHTIARQARESSQRLALLEQAQLARTPHQSVHPH